MAAVSGSPLRDDGSSGEVHHARCVPEVPSCWMHWGIRLCVRDESVLEQATLVLRTAVSSVPSHLPFSTVAARYRCWSGLLWSLM